MYFLNCLVSTNQYLEKQIESSINLRNKLVNCLKFDDQRDKIFKDQGTQKIKILN